MSRSSLVAAALAAALPAAGCGADDPPLPRLASIEPFETYSDQPTPVTLHGSGFFPGLVIDTNDGRRTVDSSGFAGRIIGGGTQAALHEIQWISTSELRAVVEPGLSPGLYDVELRDPYGRRSLLKAAYRSLGADTDPPAVAIEKPRDGGAVAPGDTVDVLAALADPPPGRLRRVRWLIASPTLGSRPPETKDLLERPASTAWGFAFTAPWAPDGETVDITVEADDMAAGTNVGRAHAAVFVRHAPAVDSVEPLVGSTQGGTDVIVRGKRFIAGTQVLLGGLPLVGGGGTVVDEYTIAGQTAPHMPGPVAVAVQSPTGSATAVATFEYIDPPELKLVTPAKGPESGGTKIAVTGVRLTPETVLYFGTSYGAALPATAQIWRDAGLIDAQTPPGASLSDAWAVEPRLGVYRLRDAFLYVPKACLSGVAPREGPGEGGTAVTVTGCGFVDETQIRVGDSLTPLVDQVVVDPKTITGKMPPGFGLVDLFAGTDSAGYVKLPGAFAYRGMPLLGAVVPAYGPTFGGSTVTLKGSGFAYSSAVAFGGSPSPKVLYVDAGTLQAVLPAAAPGKVDVKLTTPFGASTLPAGFEYRAATDGSLRIEPSLLVRGDEIAVVVEGELDAMANTKPGPSNDKLAVMLESDAESETLSLDETAVEGTFQRVLGTKAGPAVPGDGILQMSATGTITATYADPLRLDGMPATAVATAEARLPADATVMLSPSPLIAGDALQIVIVDTDPRADRTPGGANDVITADLGTAWGDAETVVLGETDMAGRFAVTVGTITSGPIPGDGKVEIGTGDEISVRYTDPLRADGTSTGVDVVASVKASP